MKLNEFMRKYGFMPKDILENNKDTFKPEEVKKCFDTIKEVVLNSKTEGDKDEKSNSNMEQ